MLFDENFLRGITDQPIEGDLNIVATVSRNLEENPNGWSQNDYEVLLEALALISNLDDMGLIDSNYAVPDIQGQKSEDCNHIYQFLVALEEKYKAEASKLKLQKLKAHYKTNLSSGFVYEFSQGDLDRVQVLINELREQINISEKVDEDHKRRLLLRLEKLQSELHKKMSDLDKFWGLVGDAGVALGKFGNDVKPIVDRIIEIKDIVWRTQVRAEELPSDFPLPRLEDQSSGTELA